jgi:hypothetical protein
MIGVIISLCRLFLPTLSPLTIVDDRGTSEAAVHISRSLTHYCILRTKFVVKYAL